MAEKKKERRDLSETEKVKLAGAIWIYGSIDLEIHRDKSKKLVYCYPRIMLSILNLLAYDYEKDTEGHVWAGKDGYYTLEIGPQDLIEKRLKEILPYLSGVEKRQADIALQVITLNRSGKAGKENEFEALITEWKKCRSELKNWVKKLRDQYKDVKKEDHPTSIWSRAYRLTPQCRAIELLQFQLTETASEEDLREAVDAFVDGFLRPRNGFVSCELVEGEGNFWMCVIHWATLKGAEAAIRDSESHSTYNSLAKLMESSSIQRRTFRIRKSLK